MDVPARTRPREAPGRPHPPGPSRLVEPRLSVVIVNYHHWDDTARLVRQLRASIGLRRGRVEVVIVDNHSPAHPIVPRLRRLEGVSLRRWGSNRGFARAVNEGCRLARGQWLLLLNPDMTLPANFLDEVLDRVEHLAAADLTAGVVGLGLRDPDGARQLSTGRFPTLAGTLLRLALPRRRRKYTAPAGDGPCPVGWVTGCCMVVRRDCWDDLGGLDPAFFLYYEDVDLCRRAWDAGWSVWHDPGPWAVHHHPLHSRAVAPHIRLITRHALLTYARKYWPRWQARALTGIVGVEARVRRLLASWRGDGDTAAVFAELARVAGSFAAGRPEDAARRLLRVVRLQEERLAATVDHRAVPQPDRPAPPLPVERHPPCAAGHADAGR
jgi:GT2 family glycosyltransferase